MVFLLLALALAFDARLTSYTYPYPVQLLALESQGQKLELAYLDVRPEKPNGRAVMLFHGKNMSGAYWAPTIKALVGLGYRVVVPDQIGFGKSSKPVGFQFTFQELATHNKRLLDELKIPQAAVVGHSMGGMLATRFALMYPGACSRLALVNPLGLEDWRRYVPYAPIDALYAKELKSTPEDVKKYMTDAYFSGQWKPEYDSLLEIHAGWMKGPDYPVIARLSALTTDMIFTQPVLYELGELKMPVLLLIGAKDRTAIGKDRAAPEVRARLGNYPELARAAQAAIPGSTLVLLKGSGHVPQLDDFPSYLKALTEFLEAGT